MALLYEAASLVRPDDLGSNMLLMFDAGRSEQEVFDYLLHYTVEPEAVLRNWLQDLRSPLMRLYAFSYAAGKQLVEDYCFGTARATAFKTLLTEQVYPSELRRRMQQ